MAFNLVYISYNSTSTIQESVLEQKGYPNLGLINLASSFLSMGMFSVFGSNLVVYSLGVRNSLILGSLCFVFWIGITIIPMVSQSDNDTFLMFIYTSSMLAGLVLGIGSSLIWVANGK